MLSLSSLLPEIEVETFAKAIFNVAEERREDIGAVLRGLLTFAHYLRYFHFSTSLYFIFTQWKVEEVLLSSLQYR